MLVLQCSVSNPGLEYWESRINLIPVDPDRMTEGDRNAYIEATRDVTDLDAVVVVASGNIDVSACFSNQNLGLTLHTIEIY